MYNNTEPSDLSLLYIPTPAQCSFHKLQKRYKLFEGGAGNGKSMACLAEAVYFCIKYPGNIWLIGRHSYLELKDTVLPMLRQLLSDIPYIFHSTDMRLTLANGSELRLRSLENKHAVGKLKGQTLGGAFIDEATEVDEEAYRILKDRLRLPGVPHRLLLATNPAGFLNWVYCRFHQETDSDTGYISAATFDNPHLPADYLHDRTALAETDPLYYKRMVLGEWGDYEGLVYPTFSYQRHVWARSMVPNRYSAYYIGIDWGAENPCAIVLIGVDYDKSLFILEEYYHTGSRSKPSDWIAAVQSMIVPLGGAFQYAIADPSGRGYINEFRNAGIQTIPGNNDIPAGIGTVKELLAHDKLIITQECRHCINEFQTYKWNEGTDRPLKRNDHTMDALRYAAMHLHAPAHARHIGRPH